MGNSFIDVVIRIKNGYMARRDTIETRYSRFTEALLSKLKDHGYITDFVVHGEIKKGISVTLRYEDGMPAVTDVKLASKPGARNYISYKDIQSVLGGMGLSFLSTSKGIKTNIEAKKEKIGGELLFLIW